MPVTGTPRRGQRYGDATRADRELERPAVACELGQAVHRRAQHLGGEHAGPRGVVALCRVLVPDLLCHDDHPGDGEALGPPHSLGDGVGARSWPADPSRDEWGQAGTGAGDRPRPPAGQTRSLPLRLASNSSSSAFRHSSSPVVPRGVQGHSDAHRHGKAVESPVPPRGTHGVDHPPGHGQRRGGVGGGQEDQELLAADTADHVIRAGDRTDQGGQGSEHVIASRVPVALVDRLEVVHVQSQDGKDVAVRRGGVDESCQLVVHVPAVVQAGQGVPQCRVTQCDGPLGDAGLEALVCGLQVAGQSLRPVPLRPGPPQRVTDADGVDDSHHRGERGHDDHDEHLLGERDRSRVPADQVGQAEDQQEGREQGWGHQCRAHQGARERDDDQREDGRRRDRPHLEHAHHERQGVAAQHQDQREVDAAAASQPHHQHVDGADAEERRGVDVAVRQHQGEGCRHQADGAETAGEQHQHAAAAADVLVGVVDPEQAGACGESADPLHDRRPHPSHSPRIGCRAPLLETGRGGKPLRAADWSRLARHARRVAPDVTSRRTGVGFGRCGWGVCG